MLPLLCSKDTADAPLAIDDVESPSPASSPSVSFVPCILSDVHCVFGTDDCSIASLVPSLSFADFDTEIESTTVSGPRVRPLPSDGEATKRRDIAEMAFLRRGSLLWRRS